MVVAALSAAWLALILIVPSGIVGATRAAVDRLIDALARHAGLDPEAERAAELAEVQAQTSSLELRTAAGRALTLTFGAEAYRHASGVLLFDDDEPDVVVLGSFFMRRLALEFDDEHLGVARLGAAD